MLFEYPTLRCDLAQVKIADIIDNKITFTEMRKTGKLNEYTKITIELNQDTIGLIDFNKEYLIDIKAKDRCDGYRKKVKTSTGYTVTDIRKLCTRNNLEILCEKYNIDKNDFVKVYKELEQLELNNNHSVKTAIDFYL